MNLLRLHACVVYPFPGAPCRSVPISTLRSFPSIHSHWLRIDPRICSAYQRPPAPPHINSHLLSHFFLFFSFCGLRVGGLSRPWVFLSTEHVDFVPWTEPMEFAIDEGNGNMIFKNPLAYYSNITVRPTRHRCASQNFYHRRDMEHVITTRAKPSSDPRVHWLSNEL
jgi:hypothetical protein